MGMTGEVALVLAKKYVQATAAGLGAVKGAPATIQQIADIDGGHRITFGWVGTDGTQQTSTLDVMNGAKGDPGYTPVKGTDYFDGDPGYSPTITVTNIAGGHKVTVTSEDGPTSFNVMDGEPFTYDDFTPEQLEGLKGADGISPIVTITGTTGGHIVSFTDKDGVKDFVVKDGTTLNDDEVGLTTTFSSDKITKTFATLEEVNKRIPQHYVLPTPTEACNGQVVQFIGITTEDYVHNYFYECVQVEGSYRWVNIVVQNVPTKVSELTNDSNFVTETELNKKGYLTEHQDISGKVDKEEGKSLIADSEITRLSTVKNYDDSVVKEDIATIKTDYATKAYVGEQIAAADHLKREIVTEVPTAETAVENVIYMLKVESAIGADKYKEYMLIDGEIACVGDTSVDLTDYAKKNEIPAELPANGGNADTVNTHTVASDVPENAVFTDTIYDDTKIKDDLSTLKYDNTHGGENLCTGLDFVNAIIGTGLTNITVDETQGTIRFTQNNSSNYKNNGFIISDSNYNFKESTQYSVILTGFSEDSANLNSSIVVMYTDGSSDAIFLKGITKETASYTSKASKTVKSIKYEFTGQNYKVLYYNECGVFEGMVSENDFKPHIPSVKMLAEGTDTLKKETTVNLLNPTLETRTSNGVTLTANGDGTYTLNGTATSGVSLSLGKVSLKANKSYKLIAQSPTDTSTNVKVRDLRGTFFGDGTYKGATPILTPTQDLTGLRMTVEIAASTSLNKFIVKPMLTTNLDATYDDFVPYTGDTGKLNSDVADIKSKISQQSAKIDDNTASFLKTIHEVYSMKIGNSAVASVVINDFKIDPAYRYLYIINGSGTTGYEVGILMFINSMKFVPLSSSNSETGIKDSVSAIGVDIYIEQGQLKVSRSATSYASTCVIYKLG